MTTLEELFAQDKWAVDLSPHRRSRGLRYDLEVCGTYGQGGIVDNPLIPGLVEVSGRPRTTSHHAPRSPTTSQGDGQLGGAGGAMGSTTTRRSSSGSIDNILEFPKFS